MYFLFGILRVSRSFDSVLLVYLFVFMVDGIGDDSEDAFVPPPSMDDYNEDFKNTNQGTNSLANETNKVMDANEMQSPNTSLVFMRFCERNVNVCFVFVLWLGCIKMVVWQARTKNLQVWL